MRFNITRLCGGKALMASPSEIGDYDLDVVSEKLKDRIKGASIHAEVMGSDHCPVELVID